MKITTLFTNIKALSGFHVFEKHISFLLRKIKKPLLNCGETIIY